MKKMILVAVTAAAATLYGADLLTERVWKFAKTWNAAGNLNKLADGTYQLHSEDDILRTEQAFRKLLAGHMAQFTADLGLK